MPREGEYAAAGVDYTKIEPFKRAMAEMGRRTFTFPNKRKVFLSEQVLHSHGAVYEYVGSETPFWCQTQEGLGHKNWIAQWMYQYSGTGRTYYDGIGIDAALMAVNDVIAQGAMPVVYTDEVAAGDSEWFADEKRSQDLAQGFYRVCMETGMALAAGESPALRYLIKAELPVTSAPSLSGCVTGIIVPKSRMVTGHNLQAGDHIIGVTSSGMHANGISLVIRRAMDLADCFLTKLSNGKTLGEEALIPTRSYVALLEALWKEDIQVHALLPGTGSGVSKIAFDTRPFTYRIHSWVDVPILFQYMKELGVTLKDCLTTFNMGVGYFIFASESAVDDILRVGSRAGYELMDIGIVEDGERKVIFEPEDITLPPPGE